MADPSSCTNGGLTMCAWLYIKSCDSSSGDAILTTSLTSSHRGIFFKCNGPSSDTLTFSIRIAAGVFRSEIGHYDKNKWFHFCVLWDKTAYTDVHTFINGIKVGGSSSSGGKNVVGDGKMILGDSYINGAPSQRSSHVIIDDLLIFEQVLQARDVLDIYKWYNHG